jgi:hypothetical protein
MAQLQGKVAQTANLFRDLGIGSDDVVAFLFNAMETVLSLSRRRSCGHRQPDQPLLDADQIGAILRKPTLKSW